MVESVSESVFPSLNESLGRNARLSASSSSLVILMLKVLRVWYIEYGKCHEGENGKLLVDKLARSSIGDSGEDVKREPMY